MGEVRLFLAPEQFEGTGASLTASQHHYLRQVLRLRAGARCLVLDGCGRAWRGTFDGEQFIALADELHPAGRELPVHVCLACAVPKGERWEWLLEKATELGVAEVVPLVSERSVVHPRPQRLERWQAIVREAAEQCERAILPRVHLPLDFQAFLRLGVAGARFICTARGTRPSLWSQLPPSGPGLLTVVSGPEGGFSDGEIAQAVATGFQPVALGGRVLRAETAPLVALSWLGARFEA
jgi:16S rRNA (uracil1498-N3)-methyltransferase